MTRWTAARGRRPVRIANCSGATSDPGYQMLRQMTQGDVDFVVGDYLAELNLAQNAEAFAKGQHPGYEPSAWDGIQQSIDTINAKRIKVILNGGALNPLGLAKQCQELVAKKGYDLKVAAVTGDDVLEHVKRELHEKGNLDAFKFLDFSNKNVVEPKHLHAYLNKEVHPLVSAHAYLGARGITQALENGADIVLCGRVADAAPVIGAARYWFSWPDTAYDQFAGALVAGHLIECSAYVTGANFASFEKYPHELLIDLPFGIAEVDSDGSAVITKHENTSGMVTMETVKSQLLYEIQGNIYLNSDVSAYLDNVQVEEISQNRVRVFGAVGAPPPPTTKLAISYKAGFQAQLLANLGGYAVSEKHAFWEKQLRYGLDKKGLTDKFTELEFQQVGTAQDDAKTMLASTTYMRIFVSAPEPGPLIGILQTFAEYAMQLVSGAHGSADLRNAMPLAYLSYFPALYPQSMVHEKALILDHDGSVSHEVDAGHPSKYQDVKARQNNNLNVTGIAPDGTNCFGQTRAVPLGDVALGRSGDKGGNINIGLFVSGPKSYPWFREYMSSGRMKKLMGDEWRDSFFIERVEFPNLLAVHFVIYGYLGRGAASTSRLDLLGKGFADWIRSRICDVPVQYLEGS